MIGDLPAAPRPSAVPPSPPRRRRRGWGSVVLVSLLGALIAGVGRQWLAQSRAAANARPATVADVLARGNPYSWAAASYLGDRERYLRGAGEMAASTLERAWPSEAFTIGQAVATDSGRVLLTTVPYRGTMSVEGVGRTAVRGESRSYAHVHGIAAVEVVCATASPGCDDFAGLTAHVDKAIFDGIDRLSLDTILPPGQCERTQEPLAGEMSELASCDYDGGVKATARLLSVEQARKMVRAVVKTDGG
jgi:hypothetical protein